MNILIFLFSLLLSGVLLYLGIRKRTRTTADPETEDRAVEFLENFCRLRTEQDVLGSAYLTFTRDPGATLSLQGEMILFFSGSTVTIRDTLGWCRPEDAPALTECIRQRVLSAFPSAEFDLGAQALCVR